MIPDDETGVVDREAHEAEVERWTRFYRENPDRRKRDAERAQVYSFPHPGTGRSA